MTKPKPRPLYVEKYMAKMPWTIGHAQSMSVAHKMMRDKHIRHLPVLDGGKLVGIITERDLALVEAMPDVNPTNVLVSEAMTTAVYQVAPETPLATVASIMARRKLGSAVVMDDDRVIGVFTAVDALRALADALR